MNDLKSKVSRGQKDLDWLARDVSTTRDKAARKATALKKRAERQQAFEKYDSDKDGRLSRAEVVACGTACYGFEPTGAVLDKIMSWLEPVTVGKFRAMQQKVAIAKS